ncbi:class I SAM-dependent methyltransferase [Viridibacterium curvum]|uniref:Class I SAM-dependent methyltransferase n=1 Tax=Viridibacterium curvum TaxID=1101404 RepID=A0ABP9QEA1_9RHOO
MTTVTWTSAGLQCAAAWLSAAGHNPPKRIEVVDDQLDADTAHRFASEGTAMLWHGDYQSAKLLLQALARRVERSAGKARPAASITEAFHKHRMTQAQRSRILGMILLPVEAGFQIALKRAPDVAEAFEQVFGAEAKALPQALIALREVQGLIGAYEWRKKGVEIPVLGARIHPWHGIFSPVRGEYLELIAKADLPKAISEDPKAFAFDIGTGTGVIAALLAKRGIKKLVATDIDDKALACARDNLQRQGCIPKVKLEKADLFPQGKAALIVCNPPWLPGKPGSSIENAIYDPDSRMLKGFLAGLTAHLVPGGEGWLILSDLAEHLGLRSRAELEALFAANGLRVAGRLNARPTHPKARDENDPLSAARGKEITSLWRLTALPA